MMWRRWISFAGFSLAAVLAAKPAAAQLAPTGGHYANQPSDTGFTAGVSSSGGYSTAVPLDLPGARNGLPVPVSIVYGGGGVGAAGLGWDVPLSYIYVDQTIAHRRPMPTANGGWQSRLAVSLVLEGRALDLVQSGSDWVARRDAPDILVRQQSDGTWVVFDGQGRTYSFTVAATPGNPAAAMWLLKRITGVGGSKVDLDYSITTPTVPGGGGLAIDLTSVSYNPHPTTANCFKNAVALVYDADVAPPLSQSMLGDRILVRTHKLLTVNVKSKATCGDAYVSLRTYQLDYTSDLDTQLPRLQSVQVFGRDGTPEATSAIPLAKYQYGAATSAGKLHYQPSSDHAGSTFVQPFTTITTIEGNPTGVSGLGFSTWASLLDLTGDGLPDSIQTALPVLNIVIDWLHSEVAQSIQDGLFPNALEKRTLKQERYRNKANDDLVWRQAIDINGDGRMDIIDAGAEPGRWIVYLNVPDLSNPTTIHWERRSYSSQVVAEQLTAHGLSVDPDHVPLARHTTIAKVSTTHCWSWDVIGQLWKHRLCGTTQTETTFTEWEVRDVNGDGYPDVVFNTSPIVFETFDPGIPDPPPNPEDFSTVTTVSTATPVLADTNDIQAVFNFLGVHIGLDSQPYGTAALLKSHDRCGVAQWQEAGSGRQKLVCDVVDINGDGIADRVDELAVYLGTGVLLPTGFFTPAAALTLPDFLSIQHNDQAVICENPEATPATRFTTRLLAGLRDLTGDGVPDYVSQDDLGNWRVAIGTGASFLTAILIEGDFALSSQDDACGGFRSTTAAGLYDIDGDGKPDVLLPDGSVNKVVGSLAVLGAPEAGRLVRVDNGFGATTTITYRSAKLLASSPALANRHQVPFPEIVVSSVETVKTQSLGTTLLAKTQYAYGGAQLVFDAALDTFRFPGYRRHVALRIPTEQTEGLATITDAYGPNDTADPFDLGPTPRTPVRA